MPNIDLLGELVDVTWEPKLHNCQMISGMDTGVPTLFIWQMPIGLCMAHSTRMDHS